MRKKIFISLLLIFSIAANAQNIGYGQEVNLSTSSKKSSKLTIQNTSFRASYENCDDMITCENLENGVFINGNNGQRAAIDIPIESNKQIVISQIKVTLSSVGEPEYVNFRFFDNEDGIPGNPLFDVTDGVIIDSDSIGFVDLLLLTVRNITVELANPIVLNGSETSERFWMSAISDANAWSTTNGVQNGADITGLGIAMGSENDDVWFVLGDIEGLYEIEAECFEQGEIPDYECYQGDVSNDFEYGMTISNLGSDLLADDFIVEPGTLFNLHQIWIDILSFQENITDVTFNFYNNNNGSPGNLIQSVAELAPSSQTLIGESAGFYVYRFIFDLPETLTFHEGTYWIQPRANAFSSDWELTSEGNLGFETQSSIDNGETWNPTGYQAVFYVAGECPVVTGINSQDEQQITVYPNPTNGYLSVKSVVQLKLMELYDMTGKKLISSESNFLNLLDVDKGFYLLKIELINGNIVIEKIIKQ